MYLKQEYTNYVGVTVTAIYPDSKLNSNDVLYIRGDNCGMTWNKGFKLIHSAKNTWNITLLCSNNITQLINFKILVSDSQWEVGSNSMINITLGTSYTVYPFFVNQAGTLDITKNIYSPVLKNFRNVITYLPPSYNENTLKVYNNILIMHDGQNLFDPNTAFLGNAWMCQDTVNSMVNTGNMEEVIIIGIYNTNDREDEYTYSYDSSEQAGGKGDLYLDFIQNQVMPQIKSKYRINPTLPRKLNMIGSSLGGLISCYAGWTRSNIYQQVGCMSSSFWWNNEDFLGTVLQKPTVNPNLVIYLDSGDSGPSQDDEQQTISVRDDLENQYGFQLGQNLFYYLDKGGQHNEYYWGKRFSQPMQDLFSPKPLLPN